MDDPRDRLLDAALFHVPLDGWSEEALRRAAHDADISIDEAHALFPRGAVDMAVAYHRRGDAEMRARLAEQETDTMRYRDRVARAIRTRLDVADKEAVRRGVTLFALPMHAADGTRAMWGTADAIWEALGDTSRDGNWYTKRATLSGVYASVVLYWLGDDSLGGEETDAFIDRRIDDVMQVERMKSSIASTALGRAMMAGPNWLMSRISAPGRVRNEYPGSVGDRR